MLIHKSHTCPQGVKIACSDIHTIACSQRHCFQRNVHSCIRIWPRIGQWTRNASPFSRQSVPLRTSARKWQCKFTSLTRSSDCTSKVLPSTFMEPQTGLGWPLIYICAHIHTWVGGRCHVRRLLVSLGAVRAQCLTSKRPQFVAGIWGCNWTTFDNECVCVCTNICVWMYICIYALLGFMGDKFCFLFSFDKKSWLLVSDFVKLRSLL